MMSLGVPFGTQKPVPRRDLERGQSRFLDRRDIGRCRRAVAAGDRVGLYRAGFELAAQKAAGSIIRSIKPAMRSCIPVLR